MSESRAATIGALVRAERIRQGVGFRELARAAGIAPATLYDLENGKTRRANINTVMSLAEALKVSVAALLP